jgi:DNA polymerase-3 subunit gamma/tau
MATYQSLYRRYRPQRFDEVLGQAHVTKALRNAVRDGRVGHAYLFSGPRGTGKTSTARILAKVLNCVAPVDGEPCGKCESCVAVAEGRVIDWLLEQDAASKSKVDDMRDLLERVPLGTSGNRKVIILDEVHMLSQGAENALLKTLEEPPSHVLFVLATTDPQKVRPTIRSRTQHFEFRLLPPDVLADHVRHVIDDAGLSLDGDAVDQAIEHVIRSGAGSARDTLSALDQVAALGEVVDESQPVDAVLDALCDRDAGGVLVAVADALASGRDPRTLGETLISALRDAFLALMGAADEHLAPAERERAARLGERLGAPGLTRALELLGEALTELSRKPDPRIVVEVALVRITQPSADRTLDAVLDRLDRLERTVATGESVASPGSTSTGIGNPTSTGIGNPTGTGAGASPSPSSPGSAGAGTGASPDPVAPAAGGRGGVGSSAARDALSTARRADPPSDPPAATSGPAGRGSAQPTLGAVARGRRAKAKATMPSDDPDAEGGDAASDAVRGGPARPATATTPAGGEPVASPAPDVAAGGGTPAGGLPGPAELDAAWSGAVLAGLPVKIRSKWRGGRWAEPGDGALRFAVPNEWHQKACDGFRREVEQALAGHFGHPVAVAVVVEGDGAGEAALGGALSSSSGRSGVGPPGTPSGAAPADDANEHIDPSELRDADGVATNGVDMLLREFGGGELVEEEP